MLVETKIVIIVFYQAWGWDQKDFPKRRFVRKILRRVITQKCYNTNFIVSKALDHM